MMSSSVDLPEPLGPTMARRASGLDEQVDVLEHRVVAESLGHPVELDDLVAEPGGAGAEFEVVAPHAGRLRARR